MDLSKTILSDSSQLNADDLMSGSQTFTIEKVAESESTDKKQPVDVHLKEHPVPWRPCLTMRRLLVAMWGPDGAKYAGRRLTLFRDPDVQFGNAKVGGIRILQASDIDNAFSTSLTTTRGRKSPFTVQPLPADSKGGDTKRERQKKIFLEAREAMKNDRQYWIDNMERLEKELPESGWQKLVELYSQLYETES